MTDTHLFGKDFAVIEPMLYETHMHTPLCKHAVGRPQDYAAVAQRRGLAGITVTCHNAMPDGFAAHVRMAIDQFDEYLAMIDAARRRWLGRIDVRLGLECDYFPGYERWLAEQTASAPFDYVLGSVHPQLREYQQLDRYDDPIAYQRAYFQRLAEAAETGLFDCLSHPDLVKNVTAEHWSVRRVMDDVCRALDRIAATGVSMELNTSGLNKTIAEMNPGPQILQQMRARSIPVVVGADAHEPGRAGDRFDEALHNLLAAGYTTVGYYLARQRQELSIADALASLEAVEDTVAR